ncbi:MAG: hypothetical protein AAF992_10840 [Bacteroidota bacterium]
MINYYYTLLTFSVLLLSLTHCQRANFQPEEIDQDYITFGKGGGMANQVDTYYLLQNGRVYHHDKIAQEYTALPRLKKSERSQVFTQAKELPSAVFGYQEPGNIYYFLTVHTDTVRQSTWGSNDFTPAEELTTYYEYLQQLTTN